MAKNRRHVENMAQSGTMSADELRRLRVPGKRLELVREHSLQASRLATATGRVLDKVADWLEAGSRIVWVVDPEGRLARVYRADGSESAMDEDGSLEGEDVVPGFRCELSAIL